MQKRVTLRIMGHTWINRLLLEKLVTLGKMSHTLKIGHTWKNESLLEECATVGKMVHT